MRASKHVCVSRSVAISDDCRNQVLSDGGTLSGKTCVVSIADVLLESTRLWARSQLVGKWEIQE